jgi:hypothetical protein
MEAKAMRPDYFIVFPWHFSAAIQNKERSYVANGGKLVFPLPKISVFP